MSVRGILLTVILASALIGAACTDEGSPVAGGTDTASSAGPTSSGPSSEPTASTSSEAPAVPEVPKAEIEDGKHFVFVKKAGNSAVTFDLAYLLTGKAAEEAAAKAGDEVPVPNDYYIVNDNPKLRTVTVGEVEVNVYDWSTCCDEYTPISYARFAGYVADPTDDFHGTLSPYWIRVQDGEIVNIQEHYLP